ncbi:MAG: zinc-binding dehydrogenase [Terrimicrobiaceae bacterium]|nr:zinc-binding dehydrogenase [Terrimicrobiaceae bacterium]
MGRIVEAGRLVRTMSVGDLVFTNGGDLWGMTHLFGGSHARQLVAEEASVVKLSPQSPSLKTMAYAALGAVARECVCRMKVEPGGMMVVFGLGMLGQLAGRLGQLPGLRVIGVNRSAWKVEAARALGFDAVCAPDAPEIEAAVKALGFGPPKLALETTGRQQIFDLALATLGSFGELSLAGYYPEKFPVDWDVCHGKQMSIHNPVGLGAQLPKVILAIEGGRLNIEPLIRHAISPKEITEFYADLIANHSRYLGVIIDWSAG